MMLVVGLNGAFFGDWLDSDVELLNGDWNILENGLRIS